MSKKKSGIKKKVVKTTDYVKKQVSPTTTRLSKSGSASELKVNQDLLFEKQNFIWMGVGLILIILGFVLMAGGSMPSQDVWDPDLIYSFRRITLAPILVLAGLIVEIYAIFKR